VSPAFELQGHRGARGLRPENTLPSFEAAFDVGVTSIETDVHLTRDGVPVLIHDAVVCPPIYTGPASGALVSRLSLAELRGYRAAGNPDPQRFPQQDAAVTPLARLFADRAGIDPYAVPTVADLFAFAAAYVGETGAAAGKTDAQRTRAEHIVFDLELKRVAFHPEAIGDDFRGDEPGLLEQRVVEATTEAKVGDRVRVRSFDHRSVQAIRKLAPSLATGLLVSGAALLSPGRLAREAGCDTYCPDYHFLDEPQVKSAHAEGVRVLCWTVNAEADWERPVAWGVDGITTDYPDRLADWLRKRGIPF
jgi:glycerophosphoryl diester phosphodiesterase